MDAIGKRFVHSLVNEKGLGKIGEFNISEIDLADEAKDAFVWVKDYVLTNNEYPTFKSISENTSCIIDVTAVPDQLVYIADIVRKRTLTKKLKPFLEGVAADIDNRDPDSAIEKLKEAVVITRDKKQKGSVLSYRKSALSRFDEYQRNKLTSGFKGIVTPWEFLNKAIQGWVNGNLHVLAGMTGIGKSWLLCYCADECERIDKKVLVVTQEMSESRIARRLDCIRYKLPFLRLRDGELDSITENDWKLELERLETSPAKSDILIAGKSLVKCSNDIELLIQEFKPDIVFIDGGYRLESNNKKIGVWEQQSQVVKDLQLSAETTNIPWIVTTQYWEEETKTGSKRATTKRSNVKYAKEWIIDPDVAIVLRQDADMQLVAEMEFDVIKLRDGDGNRTAKRIHWKRETVNFKEIDGGDPFEGWFKKDSGTPTPASSIVKDVKVDY